MAILSKGITLKMGATSQSLTALANLLDIPDIGGDVDKVEITTLSDPSRKYMNGLIDYGELEFTLLFDNSSATSDYRVCKTAEDAGTIQYFELTFIDGTKFSFNGQVSTTIKGAGLGESMQFTLKVALSSSITVTNPTQVGGGSVQEP